MVTGIEGLLALKALAPMLVKKAQELLKSKEAKAVQRQMDAIATDCGLVIQRGILLGGSVTDPHMRGLCDQYTDLVQRGAKPADLKHTLSMMASATVHRKAPVKSAAKRAPAKRPVAKKAAAKKSVAKEPAAKKAAAKRAAM